MSVPIQNCGYLPIGLHNNSVIVGLTLPQSKPMAAAGLSSKAPRGQRRDRSQALFQSPTYFMSIVPVGAPSVPLPSTLFVP